MTTIAYRNGVLAADSQCMNGEWVQAGTVAKLRRLPDGSICAGTGDVTKAAGMIDWLGSDRSEPAPRLGDSWRVIELRPDGKLLVHEEGGAFEPLGEFMAWGSGAPVANAAMIMGADAARAVEVAAMLDPQTGGPIVVMSPAAKD